VFFSICTYFFQRHNRLKYIFRGEAQIKDFGNYQGSIQKPTDTFLALIQNQGKFHGELICAAALKYREIGISGF